MRHEPVRRAFFLNLLWRLAEGQRFGLGKHVGNQHVVVAAQGIKGLAEGNEVAGDETGALVNQLVEGMLPVRSRLAPVDLTRVVVDSSSLERDVLAVALHRQLLEIGRKTLQILFIRQDRDSLGAEKVTVPE